MKRIHISFIVINLLCSCFYMVGKSKLTDFGYNKYSQFGEDGIIEKIFEIIGTQSKVCIEFGAADGFDCSNTALLWSTKGWKGILIEPSARFNQLVKNVHNYNCIPINAFVDVGNNSLELILKKYQITEPIDLLSIDVDGNDYFILQSLKELRPRLIICEYNPTMPAHLDIYPEYGNVIGCSVAALARIAQAKGYKLVAITDTNCFFVQESDFIKFNEFETSLEAIQITKYLKYIINSYFDKKYLVVGEWDKVPWADSYAHLYPQGALQGNFNSLPVTVHNSRPLC